MDMGSSDEEEEDGQVTKYDEEEEQDPTSDFADGVVLPSDPACL